MLDENSSPSRGGSPASQPLAPAAPRFRDAFLFWLKLGFISFGGPAGQIALMHEELVVARRWISERRFLHALNYCTFLPGPEAQQLATYIGWLMHRTSGGIVAGALFVLPSLAILIALSWIYLRFGNVPVVASIFYGIKPAVIAIVLHAAWRLGKRALASNLHRAIAAAAFIAISVFALPFPLIVAAAALIGVAAQRFTPQRIEEPARRGDAETRDSAALIDDDTPTPEHARPNRARSMGLVVIGALLWLLPMAALVAAQGGNGPFVQMGWFFTKAALVTFGGAYAVLPYVYQAAVAHYGWLSAAQMIDGLALGETTPGPLIMVVAFVGFLGGWHAAPFGPDALFAAGASAAIVATWFTFLPSFLFILIGGPLVESTRDTPRLAAPLAAISAAVVGVISTLALVFGRQVLWPHGLDAPLDLAAAAITAVAALLLFRFKIGVVPLIAACAIAGIAIESLRRAI